MPRAIGIARIIASRNFILNPSKAGLRRVIQAPGAKKSAKLIGTGHSTNNNIPISSSAVPSHHYDQT